MSFSSFPVHLDPPNCNLPPAAAGAGSGDGGGDAGLASAQAPGVLVSAARPTMSTAKRAQLTKLPPPEQPFRCPRCDSTNTKFCYFNNYSRSQPRHFCKACRRYWTRGGTLRSVPVGGACHRRRNSSAESSSSTSSKPTAHAGVPNSLSLNSGGTPTINSAAAGRQIELWNLQPQVQNFAFLEQAAEQPATLALPHFQAVVDLPPVKMEDHASHLGFNYLPRQYSVPPGNYHQYNWSSSNGMKDGDSGGGSAARGGGWATMADLYVFDPSSISGHNINNYS